MVTEVREMREENLICEETVEGNVTRRYMKACVIYI